MTQSIVEIRLTRNLRYKLTYIKVFEDYLELNPGPTVAEVLKSLIQAQQSAIGPVSRYLRRLNVQVQDLDLDQRLLNHAASREDVRSQLRFIHDGLRRAVSWYKTQLVDKEMVADPELQAVLLELGETDAAQLWRVEAVMAILRIPANVKEKEYDQQRAQPEYDEDWRPRLVEDVGRATWKADESPQWPRPSRYRRRDSSSR
ncbi:MAG: hypothetical protein M8467_19530 [Anaerolineae bacterium]|nr:hypothetical protein [Anaerolineae bacterium]